MSTKTFTNRSTKQEILKAYNDLAKELKQLQGQAGSPAASSASPSISSASDDDSEEQPVTQGPANIDAILRDLVGIRARLGESVGGLQQQLLGEATRLDGLHTEIAGHIVHLRELHGIEVHEDTLRELVRKYQDTQKTADEVHTQRKQAAEVELEAKKAAWKKEQEHTRTAKEAEDTGSRARKRAADEYTYELERGHKADADALAQAKKLQQAELDALKEQSDRAWAEREKELAAREKEYADLKSRSGAFQKDLEAAIQKAEAEGTGIAKRQAKIAADLQQKENDGKRRVYELKVHALEEQITKQNEQLAELSKQLATALKQAQDLAIKAIDGASNSTSFAAVKEIALEQAKTAQKTK
jgi:hypothetical protein